MDINNFFRNLDDQSKIDSTNVIKSLFEFTKAINNMNLEDLISFYQALSMLEDLQPVVLFKKNPLKENIKKTKGVVAQIMDCRLTEIKNSVPVVPYNSRNFEHYFLMKSRVNSAIGRY